MKGNILPLEQNIDIKFWERRNWRKRNQRNDQKAILLVTVDREEERDLASRLGLISLNEARVGS